MVEWRLKEGSEAVKDYTPYDYADPVCWKQAPYDVKSLGIVGEATKLVRPCIPEFDKNLSRHGLVNRKVAEACLSCLKTMIDDRHLEHIEWCIVQVKLEESHKRTLVEEPSENAKLEAHEAVKRDISQRWGLKQ